MTEAHCLAFDSKLLRHEQSSALHFAIFNTFTSKTCFCFFIHRIIHVLLYYILIYYIFYSYVYNDIYGHPPPMIHLQAFYMGITSVLCTFLFTRKMTFSCFYFFYLLRKSPTQTHTCNFVFVYFCCHFLRFWSKTQKTLRKPKKPKKQNCKTHVGTSWWVRVCNFVFFVFFWISRGF